jgi:fucose 4-O-acetylase-like acetyltransferase
VTQQTTQKKQRFLYIDRTKGLAILLVVVGHLIAREPPPGDGAEWYLHLKHAIYAFHMPLFMAVSGLVYGLSWKPRATMADDFADGARRARRLFPAYLLFGLVVFFGKLAFQMLGRGVDNPVHGASDLFVLVTQPTASFCSFLWYIYALAILYLVFPLAFRAVRGWVAWLLPITLAFWLLPTSPWFAWDRLQELSVFFVAGVVAGRHHEGTQKWLGRLWLPALVAFAVLLPAASRGEPVAHWCAAALSVIGLTGLMRATERVPLGVFELMGRYTLIIYLTNTIFIGLVKLAAMRLGLWDGAHFALVATAMTLVAVAGAIVLKRWLLPHVPPLDRITT